MSESEGEEEGRVDVIDGLTFTSYTTLDAIQEATKLEEANAPKSPLPEDLDCYSEDGDIWQYPPGADTYLDSPMFDHDFSRFSFAGSANSFTNSPRCSVSVDSGIGSPSMDLYRKYGRAGMGTPGRRKGWKRKRCETFVPNRQGQQQGEGQEGEDGSCESVGAGKSMLMDMLLTGGDVKSVYEPIVHDNGECSSSRMETVFPAGSGLSAKCFKGQLGKRLKRPYKRRIFGDKGVKLSRCPKKNGPGFLNGNVDSETDNGKKHMSLKIPNVHMKTVNSADSGETLDLSLGNRNGFVAGIAETGGQHFSNGGMQPGSPRLMHLSPRPSTPRKKRIRKKKLMKEFICDDPSEALGLEESPQKLKPVKIKTKHRLGLTEPINESGFRQCTLCKFKSKYSPSLARHRAVVHCLVTPGQKVFSCTFCEFITTYKAKYLAHVKFTHSDMLKEGEEVKLNKEPITEEIAKKLAKVDGARCRKKYENSATVEGDQVKVRKVSPPNVEDEDTIGYGDLQIDEKAMENGNEETKVPEDAKSEEKQISPNQDKVKEATVIVKNNQSNEGQNYTPPKKKIKVKDILKVLPNGDIVMRPKRKYVRKKPLPLKTKTAVKSSPSSDRQLPPPAHSHHPLSPLAQSQQVNFPTLKIPEEGSNASCKSSPGSTVALTSRESVYSSEAQPKPAHTPPLLHTKAVSPARLGPKPLPAHLSLPLQESRCYISPRVHGHLAGPASMSSPQASSTPASALASFPMPPHPSTPTLGSDGDAPLDLSVSKSCTSTSTTQPLPSSQVPFPQSPATVFGKPRDFPSQPQPMSHNKSSRSFSPRKMDNFTPPLATSRKSPLPGTSSCSSSMRSVTPPANMHRSHTPPFSHPRAAHCGSPGRSFTPPLAVRIPPHSPHPPSTASSCSSPAPSPCLPPQSPHSPRAARPQSPGRQRQGHRRMGTGERLMRAPPPITIQELMGAAPHGAMNPYMAQFEQFVSGFAGPLEIKKVQNKAWKQIEQSMEACERVQKNGELKQQKCESNKLHKDGFKMPHNEGQTLACNADVPGDKSSSVHEMNMENREDRKSTNSDTQVSESSLESLSEKGEKIDCKMEKPDTIEHEPPKLEPILPLSGKEDTKTEEDKCNSKLKNMSESLPQKACDVTGDQISVESVGERSETESKCERLRSRSRSKSSEGSSPAPCDTRAKLRSRVKRESSDTKLEHKDSGVDLADSVKNESSQSRSHSPRNTGSSDIPTPTKVTPVKDIIKDVNIPECLDYLPLCSSKFGKGFLRCASKLRRKQSDAKKQGNSNDSVRTEDNSNVVDILQNRFSTLLASSNEEQSMKELWSQCETEREHKVLLNKRRKRLQKRAAKARAKAAAEVTSTVEDFLPPAGDGLTMSVAKGGCVHRCHAPHLSPLPNSRHVAVQVNGPPATTTNTSSSTTRGEEGEEEEDNPNTGSNHWKVTNKQRFLRHDAAHNKTGVLAVDELREMVQDSIKDIDLEDAGADRWRVRYSCCHSNHGTQTSPMDFYVGQYSP